MQQFGNRRTEAINKLYSREALMPDSHTSVNRNTPLWLKRIRVAELLNEFCEDYGVEGSGNRKV